MIRHPQRPTLRLYLTPLPNPRLLKTRFQLPGKPTPVEASSSSLSKDRITWGKWAIALTSFLLRSAAWDKLGEHGKDLTPPRLAGGKDSLAATLNYALSANSNLPELVFGSRDKLLDNVDFDNRDFKREKEGPVIIGFIAAGQSLGIQIDVFEADSLIAVEQADSGRRELPPMTDPIQIIGLAEAVETQYKWNRPFEWLTALPNGRDTTGMADLAQSRDALSYHSINSNIGALIGDVTPEKANEIRQRVEQTLREDNDPSQHGLLGIVLAAVGFHRRAMELLESATKYSPDDAVAWMNLGKCYQVIGRFKESEDALLTALSLDPSLADVMQDQENQSDQVAAEVRELLEEIESKWSRRKNQLQRAVIELAQRDDLGDSFPIELRIEKTDTEISAGQVQHTVVTNAGTVFFLSRRDQPENFVVIYAFQVPSATILRELRRRKHLVHDNFGLRMLESQSTDEVILFSERLPYTKVSCSYLFKVIIKSIMLHSNLPDYLEGKGFWEVSLD